MVNMSEWFTSDCNIAADGRVHVTVYFLCLVSSSETSMQPII